MLTLLRPLSSYYIVWLLIPLRPPLPLACSLNSTPRRHFCLRRFPNLHPLQRHPCSWSRVRIGRGELQDGMVFLCILVC